MNPVPDPNSILPADMWPSPPPIVEVPQALRQAVLGNVTTASIVQSICRRIDYYPEVQLSTLELLADRPSRRLLTVMADAVLTEMTPGPDDPSEDDRLRAVHAVQAALSAAASLTVPDHTPLPE